MHLKNNDYKWWEKILYKFCCDDEFIYIWFKWMIFIIVIGLIYFFVDFEKVINFLGALL